MTAVGAETGGAAGRIVTVSFGLIAGGSLFTRSGRRIVRCLANASRVPRNHDMPASAVNDGPPVPIWLLTSNRIDRRPLVILRMPRPTLPMPRLRLWSQSQRGCVNRTNSYPAPTSA